MELPKKHKAEPLEENAVGESSTFMIDLNNFQMQLKKFYAHWREHQRGFWSGCDILAVAVSPSSDTKSSAFSLWLFGHQVTHLIMIFLEKQIHFLCAEEKVSLPETLKMAARKAVDAELTIHLKPESDDRSGLMDEILRIIQDECKSNGCEFPLGGFLLEETPEGKLLEILSEKWKQQFQLHDVADGFSELLLIKDGAQLMNVRKAASLVSHVMEHFVAPECHDMVWMCWRSYSVYFCPIDEMEKLIFSLKKKTGVKPENIELCYRPIFQRGYGFNLDDLSLETYDWDRFGIDTAVIISAIGLRYNGFCANIARTFLINPHPVQLKAFEVLLKAQKSAIDALKPGNKASAAYQAAASVIEKEAPEFFACMTSSAGAGIGLEFHEAGLRLDSSNNRVLKSGMVFNVSLGFENVHAETNNPITEKFSLLLADTVVINEVGAENLTFVRLKGEFGYVHRDTHRYLPASLLKRHHLDTSDCLDTSGMLFPPRNVTVSSNVGESMELSVPVQIKKELNAVLVPVGQSIVPFHVSLIDYAYNDHRDHPDYVSIAFNQPRRKSTSDIINPMQVDKPTRYLQVIKFSAGNESGAKRLVNEIKALQQQFCVRYVKRAKLSGCFRRTYDLLGVTDYIGGPADDVVDRCNLSYDRETFRIGSNSGSCEETPSCEEIISTSCVEI